MSLFGLVKSYLGFWYLVLFCEHNWMGRYTKKLGIYCHVHCTALSPKISSTVLKKCIFPCMSCTLCEKRVGVQYEVILSSKAGEFHALIISWWSLHFLSRAWWKRIFHNVYFVKKYSFFLWNLQYYWLCVMVDKTQERCWYPHVNLNVDLIWNSYVHI